MIYVGLTAAAISILLLFFWLFRLIGHKRHIAKQRWDDFHRELDGHVTGGSSTAESKPGDLFAPRKLGGVLSSSKPYRSLERKLAQGNIYLHPGEFALIVMVWGIVLGGILYLISRSFLLFILGFIIALLIGNVHLKSRRNKKIKDFDNQIVDMLTLVSNGLRAGYSLFQSIEIVARDMQPPISVEFGRMMKQVNMGLTVEEGLNEMLDRIESPDLELVVTAILIQRQVGGNLSEVLDGISHTIRERVIMKNQLKVLTSQGRMSGTIISLLAPGLALIIYLMNPGFMVVMIKEPLGIAMIGIAVLLQLIGIFFIRRIVDIRM